MIDAALQTGADGCRIEVHSRDCGGSSRFRGCGAWALERSTRLLERYGTRLLERYGTRLLERCLNPR